MVTVKLLLFGAYIYITNYNLCEKKELYFYRRFNTELRWNGS